jgi:hypothetical protein
MSKLIFRLVHDEAKKNAKAAIDAAGADHTLKVCVIMDETRTLEQNAYMWPILRCFSKQVELPVDGAMVTLEEEAWKDVMTAVFRGETLRMVKYGQHLVMVGASTSAMGKKQFADFLTFLLAEAVERNVVIPPRAHDDVRDYIREHGNARA